MHDSLDCLDELALERWRHLVGMVEQISFGALIFLCRFKVDHEVPEHLVVINLGNEHHDASYVV